MLGKCMEAEICEQPRALSDNAKRYESELTEAVGGLRPEMAVLVARGSSDNAALFGRYLIEIHLQIPVSLAAPSVLTRYGSKIKYPKCLAIGISQSGAAPDVAEVLARLREEGHSTLAITNTAGSRVTEAAEHSLIMEVGPEMATAATKTYTASLLALYALVKALGGRLPEIEVPTESWLESTRAEAEAQVGHLVRNHILFALGRGYGFTTVHETALKLMECALLPCKSYSSADFQHGPRALAGPGSSAIVYGDPVHGLAEQGCAIVQAPKADVPEPLRPIFEIFFGQWIALLAARGRAIDPDQPPYIQKITETR